MPIATCDPLALHLTKQLHEELDTDITILFGSRSRGDHKEGRSDIDIMLVTQHYPDADTQN